jgi:acetyl esterase/lipase
VVQRPYREWQPLVEPSSIGRAPRPPESPRFWAGRPAFLLADADRTVHLWREESEGLTRCSPLGQSIGSTLYAYGAPAWCPYDDDHAVVLFRDGLLALVHGPSSSVVQSCVLSSRSAGYPVVLGDGLIAIVCDDGPVGGRAIGLWQPNENVLVLAGATSDLVADLVSVDDGLWATRWPSGTMPWDAGTVMQLAPRDGVWQWEPVFDNAVVSKAPGGSSEQQWLVAEKGEWFRPQRRERGVWQELAVDCDFNPPWTVGARWSGAVVDGSLHVGARASTHELWWWGHDGVSRRVDPSLVAIAEIDTDGDRVLLVGNDGTRPSGVIEVNLKNGTKRTVLEPVTVDWDPAWASVGEWRETDSGVPFIYYPPKHPGMTPSDGDRPPLALWAHGGPTAHAGRSFALQIQMLTSAGVAVAYVDYRGSTSYGRSYRRALQGAYGQADVEDFLDVAHYLVARGEVAPDRVTAVGSSSGGMTALLCGRAPIIARVLAHFPVTDAALLTRDTDEIEIGYLEWLIGPYPESFDAYAAVSPSKQPGPHGRVFITHGNDDSVIPVTHSRSYVERLRGEGVSVTYLEFEGEGHGYRSPATLTAVSQATLAFLRD